MSDDFWTSRASLTHVRDFALAYRCNPLGVLGVVLARVIAATDPNLVGPATVGGEWSLNLIVGLVGRSGQGKDASHAAGFAAVRLPHTREEGVGSGEGIARIFHTDKEGQQDTRRGYLTASEVDRLAAIGGRQGSTLFSTIRQLWTGSTLGFANGQQHTKTNVPAHSYRAVMEIGIQPEGAGPLLADTKGTAQRILWLPVAQIDLPEVVPKAPEPRTLATPDDRRRVLTIPAEAEAAVIEHRRSVLAMPLVGDSGDVDPLDGHKMLTRLKVAAGLMLLDERCDAITDEDWLLAGALITVSDRIRATLANASRDALRQANRAKAHAVAERDEVVSERKLTRTKEAVIRWLERHDELPTNEIRSKLKADCRDYLGAALAELVESGQVIETRVERGSRFRLPRVQGVPPVQGAYSQFRTGVREVQGVPHPENPPAETVPGDTTDNTPGLTPRVLAILDKEN